MLAAQKIYGPGLCSTCNNASECVLRAKRGFDAIYCETFDNLNGNGSARRKIILSDTLPKPADKSAKITYLGLCVNCENRDNCRLSRPEEGVWHCEEYR